MHTVSLLEAQQQLAQLVAQAAQGEPFVIEQAGVALVKVVPFAPPVPARRLGFMQGQIKVPDDFDTLGAAEIEQMFNHPSA